MITVDQLIAGANPESRDEAVALMTALAAAQTRIAAALANHASASEQQDRLLNAEEAAKLLAVDAQWLYRRSRKLPFVVRLDGKLRFSARGIARYIEIKSGR
jgi:hypothetical protein